ncbi:MAG: GtrA family protein [Bacteroidales bacterium]
MSLRVINERSKKGEFIRFIITGATATGVQYGIYYVLCQLMNPSVAFTIATIFFVLVNFVLTTYFTFKEKPTWKKASGFLVQQGVNYLLQLGFLNLFLWLHIPKELAPFPVFVIVLPINFLLLRFIFKEPRNRN